MKSYIRTDLASELRTQAMQSTAERDRGELDGIEYSEQCGEGFSLSRIRVISEAGEKKLSKPRGEYVTVEFSDIDSLEGKTWESVADAISGEVKRLAFAKAPACGSVMVCGLGNRAAAADSVGPHTLDNLLVTRHLKTECPDIFKSAGFFDICALEPGVLGTTGLEAAETAGAVARLARPDVVIAVDSLAARGVERLARTVQICDTGILPGSGIGNRRRAFDESTVGSPVIAVGVPTVVDLCAVFSSLLEDCEVTIPENNTALEARLERGRNYFVTPKNFDGIAPSLGKLIGLSVSRAFNPDFSYNELMRL